MTRFARGAPPSVGLSLSMALGPEAYSHTLQGRKRWKLGEAGHLPKVTKLSYLEGGRFS